MAVPNGVIIYHGASMLTHAPIVAILTGLREASTNPKTGPQYQLWILPASAHPAKARQHGADDAVCGSCPLRPVNHGGCYVNIMGPSSVYRAWQAGQYSDGLPDVSLRYTSVRLGAYGDPAALPLETLQALTARVGKFTGYTHQWRTCDPAYRHYLMASVETLDTAREAQASGWRTFRIRPAGSVQQAANEIVCPASPEGGHRSICATCHLCNGATATGADRRASIVITAHGPAAAYF